MSNQEPPSDNNPPWDPPPGDADEPGGYAAPDHQAPGHQPPSDPTPPPPPPPPPGADGQNPPPPPPPPPGGPYGQPPNQGPAGNWREHNPYAPGGEQPGNPGGPTYATGPSYQQQPYGYGQPQGFGPGQAPHITDYLIPSIIMTFCCCTPLGIAGIVFSARASSKKNVGDFFGAQKDSAMAKRLLIIGGAIGAVVVAIYVALMIFGAATGSSDPTPSYEY